MSGCIASWTKTPTGRGRPTASGTRPKIEDWLDELDAMGVRYCVLTDHTLEHHQPVTVYRGAVEQAGLHLRGPGPPARCGARTHRSEPFRYTKLDPAALTPASKVEIIGATSAQMNFLKDIYLAKGITHTAGLANFLVMIDGHLAGGFIYSRDKWGGELALPAVGFRAVAAEPGVEADRDAGDLGDDHRPDGRSGWCSGSTQ